MARIVEYWLQLENRAWDAAPWGVNRLTGRPLPRASGGAFRPTPREALILRRMTDNWAAPDDRPLNPWDLTEPDPAVAGGTIPGPVLTAKVADEIVVHFRNMDQRADIRESDRVHSLHPAGVQRGAVYNGAFPLSPPDPAQSNRRGDRVAPGDSFTYRWSAPHKSSAGVWLYGDAAADGRQSAAAGAFGVLLVRAAGEQVADEPPQPLRRPGDSSTRWAALPPPPRRADYVLAFHEMPGVGLCLNGRTLLGNTPALLVGRETRMSVRLLNATLDPLTVTVQGHRWERGDRYTDTEFLPPGAGATLSILSGSAEGGGGPGEWLITGRAGNTSVSGSIVYTDGGPLELLSA